CLFFFQAEDGIRDFHVTGVQTCALPISTGRPAPRGGKRNSHLRVPSDETCSSTISGRAMVKWRSSAARRSLEILNIREKSETPQIGRASCRERVRVAGGEGWRDKKIEKG